MNLEVVIIGVVIIAALTGLLVGRRVWSVFVTYLKNLRWSDL